jgi:phage gpG-like protein
MARLTIEFDQSRKDVTALFKKVQDRAVNIRPVMQDFGEWMKNSVRANFMVGGRPDAWPPMKPQSLWQWVMSRKTWRKGARHEGRLSAKGFAAKRGRKLLINTARLMGSIFWRLIPGGVAVGTRTKYGAIHQFGGVIPERIITPKKKKALYWPGAGHPVQKSKIPATTIPARPFLVVQEADWNYLVKNMSGHLIDEL